MSIRPRAGIQEINGILSLIRDILYKNNGRNFIIKSRNKNRDTITKLGFLTSHIKQEIFELTYKDYCDGPEQNRSRTGNPKGSVWKFGKTVNGIEIYIKLQVIPYGEGQCVCISFHESDKKLIYPYK